MKIKVEPSELKRVLGIVKSSVNTGTIIAVHGAVKIVVKTAKVAILSFDGLTSVTASMDAVIEETGEAVIPFDKLFGFAETVSEKITIETNEEKGKATFTCGRFVARNVNLFETVDFTVPSHTQWDGTVELDAPLFVEAAERALIAAFRKSDIPERNALVVVVKGNKLYFVGYESSRAAIVQVGDVEMDDAFYLISESVARTAIRIAKSSDTVELFLSKNAVLFDYKIGHKKINYYSPTTAGNFADMLDRVPKVFKSSVEVDSAELEKAVLINDLFRSDKPKGFEDVLRLEVSGDAMRVLSNDDAFGDVTIDATVDGKPQTVLFNMQFLKDFVKDSKAKTVHFGYNDTGMVTLHAGEPETFVNMCALIQQKA